MAGARQRAARARYKRRTHMRGAPFFASKKQVCVLCELCGVSMAEFSGIIETPL